MILDTIHFIIQYLTTIFIIIDPLAIVALFVSITCSYTVEERWHIAKMKCLVAFEVTECFAIFGEKIFNFLESRWVHFA
jgi:multiple antibiotic resistance protein